MGTCLTKSIKQYNNIKFRHGSTIQKGKSERRLQRFEVVFECFFESEKKFLVPDFSGQEIPCFDCIHPEGALIFRSMG